MSDATQLTEITVYAPADEAREIALAITGTHRVVTSTVQHVEPAADANRPTYTVRDGNGVWCGDRQIAFMQTDHSSTWIGTESGCIPVSAGRPLNWFAENPSEGRDALIWIAAVLNAEVGRA
ncbi:hypothetical protein [Mycobacteroides abscessus]|uniref:hypothetical protein n=1 Tax=Mycobacteroides abscessus TaxID=36809 RepID=UPI0009A6BEEF|nr:hypothetical protein [Mycobacteroides abscessus]MDO3233659.1 hypothetical protein [Mycobacteroides abscessus subsp. abscessus]SLI14446.1 Uncharacterised protein [Mycobacteroides abscessus subsp. massiliense]SLI23557.1 Uncharacterised protein [Mycobacteroides abscessus subsp. massiliense]SLK59682.1 Uncharacterised protein [Mycobacteroides abscessus subsp. abscessus]